MGSTYTAITQAPISVMESRKLGEFLGKYDIRASGITVYHRLENGRLVKDDPLSDTVQMVASSTGTASAIAPPTAGAMVALGIAMPVISLPVLLAGLVGSIKGYYETGKRVPKRVDALWSEITFRLDNVSPERVGWAKYLLAIYARLNQFSTIKGIDGSREWAQGVAYADTHGSIPPPWGERRGTPGARRQPATRKAQRGRSLWERIKREVW
jgi:hypothetical protein